MRETVNDKKRLYSGKVVTLDIYDVTLPDGETGKREIVQHPGAVAIVPFDDDGQVLLVKQYRTAADAILLEIPAGTAEPDEAPDITAVRELQEETGYKPGRLESIGGIYTAPGYTTEFIHLYIARDLEESRLDADSDEFIELVRMPLDEAIAAIARGDIQDGKTVAGLLRAIQHKSG
jgi:ADP-ribose pyrophosphatase